LGKERRHRRQRQLEMTVAAIQRQHGPWALVKGDRSRVTGSAAVPHIPTGFPALDRVLGIGGLPQGRVCELVGPATSGKTTLALKFLAQAQAVGPAGGQVGYLDQARAPTVRDGRCRRVRPACHYYWQPPPASAAIF